MYVIVCGQRVVGPFQNEDEAIQFGKTHLTYGWYVRAVCEPEAQAA